MADITFVEGKFGKAVNLGTTDLKININLANDYTLFCYRKPEGQSYYDHIIKLSNEKVYVNGIYDSFYDTSWIYVDDTDNSLIIEHEAGTIDELLILKDLINEWQVKEWFESQRPFYDILEKINAEKPTEIEMEVLPIDG